MNMDRECSRRDFFKAVLREVGSSVVDAADACSAALDAAGQAARPPLPKVRPPRFTRLPGALPEAEFLAACTRCDACIPACPHLVVRKAGKELGAAAGTPIIIPKENPCLFCADLPCVTACLPGALRRPPAGTTPRIGLAVVNARRCYQAVGQPCDYCMKHCPVRPKAIRVGSPGAAAVVDDQTCTGCGKCAQICPGDAIEIEAPR